MDLSAGMPGWAGMWAQTWRDATFLPGTWRMDWMSPITVLALRMEMLLSCCFRSCAQPLRSVNTACTFASADQAACTPRSLWYSQHSGARSVPGLHHTKPWQCRARTPCQHASRAAVPLSGCAWHEQPVLSPQPAPHIRAPLLHTHAAVHRQSTHPGREQSGCGGARASEPALAPGLLAGGGVQALAGCGAERGVRGATPRLCV